MPDYGRKGQKAVAMIRKGQAKDLRVTPRVKAAIRHMVCDGMERAEAAKAAGLTDNALYVALTKPHVLAFHLEQMEVLRTSEQARSLHRIVKLRDRADSERVQLDAAKYLDGMDRNANTVGAQQVNVQVNNHIELPGYVIDLSAYPANGAQQIEHLETHGPKSLEDNEDVPDEE